MDKDKFMAFIEEYKSLCKKHNMFVNGCGCCGSPYVSQWDVGKEVEEHIEHLIKEKEGEFK